MIRVTRCSAFAIGMICLWFTSTRAVLADIHGCDQPLATKVDVSLGGEFYLRLNPDFRIGRRKVQIAELSYPLHATHIEGQWVWIGKAWVRKRDLMSVDEALRYFSAVLHRDAKNQYARNIRMMLCMQNDKLQLALRDSDALLRVTPTDPQLHFVQGEIHTRQADFATAKRDLDEAIRLDPRYKDALLARCKLEMASKNFDQAIVDATALIQLDPNMAAAYYARGYALCKLGRSEAGLKDLDESIRLAPNEAGYWESRSQFKERLGMFDSALQDAETAVRLSPHKASTFAARGIILDRLRENDRALSDFSEAIRLDPKSAFYLGLRGSVYLRSKQYELSAADAEEVLRLEPKMAPGWYHRAITRVARNDFAGALDDLDEAVRLEPANSLYRGTRQRCWEYLKAPSHGLDQFSLGARTKTATSSDNTPSQFAAFPAFEDAPQSSASQNIGAKATRKPVNAPLELDLFKDSVIFKR